MVYDIYSVARPGRAKTKWPLGSRALYKERWEPTRLEIKNVGMAAEGAIL